MATDSFTAPVTATGTFTPAPTVEGAVTATGLFTLSSHYDSFQGAVRADSHFSGDSGDLANGRYRR